MAAIEHVSATVKLTLACRTLGVCRVGPYRRRHPCPVADPPRRAPLTRALSGPEQPVILAMRQTDPLDPPTLEVYATLLKERIHPRSIPTTGRPPAAAREARERWNQFRHPSCATPLSQTSPRLLSYSTARRYGSDSSRTQNRSAPIGLFLWRLCPLGESPG
jgi:hypothetical protein